MSNILEQKQARLKIYYDREALMLSNSGVKSYGIGTQNVQRYDTALKDIQDMIKKLEGEVSDLEFKKNGKTSRKAVGVILRDW